MAKTKRIPKHEVDYVIGTSVLDDGKRSIGVVFRDPVERERYRVSLTVDTSNTAYSIVSVRFYPLGLLHCIRRNLGKVGKRIKRLLIIQKSSNKKEEKDIKATDRKIKIPVGQSNQFTKSKPSPDEDFQLFLNECVAICGSKSFATCSTSKTTDSFDETDSTHCYSVSKLASELMEEINYFFGRSHSETDELDEVGKKKVIKLSRTESVATTSALKSDTVSVM